MEVLLLTERASSAQDSAQPKRGRSWIIIGFVTILALGALLFAALGSAGNGVRLGEPAPAFRVATRDGVEIDSLKLRGSVVVINFFASWCKPCQTEAPDLQAIWEDYKGRGVVMVGIAHEDVEARIADFVRQHGITFPIANADRSAGRKFGITGVPETYVIDREGTLVYKRLGPIEPAELRSALDQALQ